MLNFLKNKRGQNTAEYAILIALVIAAAVAMQTYVKRGTQGGIKYAVDKAKKAVRPDGSAATGQYEPYYLESSSDTTKSAYKDTTQTEEGGKVTRGTGEHTTTRSGYEKIRDITNQD